MALKTKGRKPPNQTKMAETKSHFNYNIDF